METMKEYTKENLSNKAPHDIILKVGDVVEWKNDYGIKFQNKVIGFKSSGWFHTKYKKYVHIDTDSWWFPHSDKELKLVEVAK